MTAKPPSSIASIDLPMMARVALLMMACLPTFAAAGITSVLPAIAAYFADTPNIEVLARLTISIVGITVAIGSPIIGMLADRYGRKMILIYGLAVYALAGTAGVLIENLYVLLGSRVIFGFATAAVGTLMLAIVAAHTDGTARPRWFGYMNTASTILVVMLIPIAGYLGRFGWHWPFVIHALALPLVVLAWRGIPSDTPAKSAATSERPAFNPREVPWWLLAFAVACGIVAMTPTLYVPFHLKEIGITDPGSISIAVVFATIGTIASSSLFGVIRSYLNIPQAFVAGFAVAAAGLLINATAAGFTGVLIGQAVAGFGQAIVAVNLYTLGAQVGVEANRARNMGIARGGLYAGPLLAQTTLEPIVARTDSGGALIAIAVCAGVLLLINVFFLLPRRPQAA